MPSYLVVDNKVEVTVPVYYTLGQLRDAVGICQETYRHWMKAVAPLRPEAGQCPSFTVGDLLATGNVKILISDYGTRVSALSTLADGVFGECNFRSGPILERSLLMLNIAGGHVPIQSEDGELALDGPMMVVVPLGRTLIEGFSRTLHAGDDDGQEILLFLPVVQQENLVPRRAGLA